MRSILLLTASLAVTGASANIQALLAWGERRPELGYNPKKIGELFSDKTVKNALGPLTFERTIGALVERGFVTNEGIYSEVLTASNDIVGQRKGADVQILANVGGGRYSLRGKVHQGRWWFTSVQPSSFEGALPSTEDMANALGFRLPPKPTHLEGAIKAYQAAARVNQAAREAREQAIREDRTLAEMGVNLPPAPIRKRVDAAIADARQLNEKIAALEAPAKTAPASQGTKARSAAKKAERAAKKSAQANA